METGYKSNNKFLVYTIPYLLCLGLLLFLSIIPFYRQKSATELKSNYSNFVIRHAIETQREINFELAALIEAKIQTVVSDTAIQKKIIGKLEFMINQTTSILESLEGEHEQILANTGKRTQYGYLTIETTKDVFIGKSSTYLDQISQYQQTMLNSVVEFDNLLANEQVNIVPVNIENILPNDSVLEHLEFIRNCQYKCLKLEEHYLQTIKTYIINCLETKTES